MVLVYQSAVGKGTIYSQSSQLRQPQVLQRLLTNSDVLSLENLSSMSTDIEISEGDTSFTCLRSERLIIRRMVETDSDSFYSYRSDPEVARYQSWSDYSREDAVAFVANQVNAVPNVPGQWIQLSIVLAENNIHIGDLAFQSDSYDPRIVQMGITLSPQHQKKGYACEAVNTLLQYFFDVLNKHRVYVIIDERNTASVGLFRRLKFQQEGHFIENVFFKGEWGNEYQFAILQKEWAANK